MVKKILDKDVLQSFVDEGISPSAMARRLKTTYEVVIRNLREHNIDYSSCAHPNQTYKFNMDKSEMENYLNMHLTYKEIAERWETQTGEKVPEYVVGQKCRDYGLHSEGNKYYMRKDNPACRADIREKISKSVKALWDSGNYSERINGMTNIKEENHPGFLLEGSSSAYRDKAQFYHPECICTMCGKQLDWGADSSSDLHVEVHHVDRNHDNYCLTNLMPLCKSCHRNIHGKQQYFTSVTKEFAFDAAHYLPFHDGKCKFIHGHTYHMAVTVRNVIDSGSGMVMDFSKLKAAVEDNILSKFDHGFLNEYIPYSTCECMIYWVWRELSKDIKGLHKLRLQETDGSYAELTVEDYKQCLPEFECAWHYSKGTDAYNMSDDYIINHGNSSYEAAQLLCEHNYDASFNSQINSEV